MSKNVKTGSNLAARSIKDKNLTFCFRIEAPPGRRVKITFSDWSIPSSGIDCEVVFISVTDLSLAGSVEQETKKKSVSFCGKNPGNGLNLTRCTSGPFPVCPFSFGIVVTRLFRSSWYYVQFHI